VAQPAFDWTAQHVLVTGGTSGIGLAFARTAQRRGALVSAIARNRRQLAADGPDAAVCFTSADVGDEAALTAAIAHCVAAHGPVTVLVASAGIVRPGYFLDLPPDEFETQMRVNYFGTVYSVRAVLPAMLAAGTGTIVGVSSAAGLLGVFGYSAYSPTKFAVRGLLETLRMELRPRGVHVAICYPPDVDTPMLAAEAPFKPRELVALSGTIKPLSATRVADQVADGIARRQAVIIPDRQTAALRRLIGVAPRLATRYMDAVVARALAFRGRAGP
jgi:3-dehydrosphinganine reductase